jgi:Bax protein
MSPLSKTALIAAFALLGLFPLEDAAAPLPQNLLPSQPEPYHAAEVLLGKVEDLSAPAFAKIRHAPARKAAFYQFLLPMVHEANLEVAKERRWLGSLGMQLLHGRSLSDTQRVELTRMEKRYRVRHPDSGDAERVGSLLKRVDTVPAALVVAQAAKESGWGTSRFATTANNYFGIWCFYQGCGVTPLKRTVGLTHEVATFSSARQSVRYYVRTLNTHVAYDGFRAMRSSKRFANKPIIGDELADGLLRYSERGLPYVREIQAMIRDNKLHRFNQPYRA